MKKIISIVSILLLSIVCVVLLGVAVKGDKGSPLAFQNELDGRVQGPFESSNSNARYALVVAIAEDKSVALRESLAKFSSPDLVKSGNRYFSIFTPGVSFVAVPFYMLGKLFGAPQLMTYLSTMVFAILNTLLIFRLANLLGASKPASVLSGFIFLFSTNALPYALTLTQHHMSIFIILSAILLALREPAIWSNILFGLLLGAGLLADMPNLLMLGPVVYIFILRHISISTVESYRRFSLRLNIFAVIVGLIPMLAVTGWYNSQSTGNPRVIPQYLGRTIYVEPGGAASKVPPKVKKIDQFTRTQPFFPRLQEQGVRVLLYSDERGWFYYMPVVLIGLIGLGLAYKGDKRRQQSVLAFGVILMTVSMYTMWGDPWGGWSFGPRYLLPATALACTGVGLALDHFRRNIIMILIFVALIAYSTWVSTIGTFTTNSIPPKGEAVKLIIPIPWDYTYNLALINANKSSSLVYNLYLKQYIPLVDGIWYYNGVVLLMMAVFYFALIRAHKVEDNS